MPHENFFAINHLQLSKCFNQESKQVKSLNSLRNQFVIKVIHAKKKRRLSSIDWDPRIEIRWEKKTFHEWKFSTNGAVLSLGMPCSHSVISKQGFYCSRLNNGKKERNEIRCKRTRTIRKINFQQKEIFKRKQKKKSLMKKIYKKFFYWV